jgi:uncharacterized membrane protein
MAERQPYVFGPVQMLVIGFEGSRFKGEILPELERLKKAGVVRIIDLLVIRKDEIGAVAKLTASDLDWEEATEYGAFIGSLIGLAQGGAEGFDRGAIAGAAELADGHFFDEDDAFRLTSAVPAGSSAAMVMIEHLWAIPLRDAIRRAEGQELDTIWVTPDELVRYGLASALDEDAAGGSS